jgi:hypothetical protein
MDIRGLLITFSLQLASLPTVLIPPCQADGCAQVVRRYDFSQKSAQVVRSALYIIRHLRTCAPARVALIRAQVFNRTCAT